MSKLIKITEQESLHDDLEHMSAIELVKGINEEDHKVAQAVELVLDKIAALVDDIWPRMKEGGRLFYIGAGTSGRLGILDASECPPTYGVPHDWVIGLIAGGDEAIRRSVEHAEDSQNEAVADLGKYMLDDQDCVIGIAASGTTPYVIGGLAYAKSLGLLTGAISCNPGAPIFEQAKHVILAEVGPEFVTGSTRMKSGTAQKMILNMISTSVMIKLGRVKGNRMVDMQLSNAKLVERGTLMVMEATGVERERAHQLLLRCGSVRAAVEVINKE